MLNETGFGAGGDSSGRTIGDVVLVGRSWFRMTSGDDEGTPVPLSTTKTARIGIDRRRLNLERRASDRRTSIAPIALPAPTEAQPVEWDAGAEMPRRTVTVSWWLVGVVGAVLMASGAAATAMVKVRSVPAPAPVVAAVPVPAAAPVTSAALPPAPAVIVEQLAPQPRPPLAARGRARGGPGAGRAPGTGGADRASGGDRDGLGPGPPGAALAAEAIGGDCRDAPSPLRSKVWVDPFAE